MNQVKQIFIDGINHINFLNGMVRIGIGTLVPTDDNENEPVYQEDYRLIMPLNSFLASFTNQKKLIDQLEEKGIITKQTEPEMADTSAIIPDVVK